MLSSAPWFLLLLLVLLGHHDHVLGQEHGDQGQGSAEPCAFQGVWDDQINRHKVPWKVRAREPIFFSNSSSCEYIGETFYAESVQYYPAQRLGEVEWQAVIKPPIGPSEDVEQQRYICHEKLVTEELDGLGGVAEYDFNLLELFTTHGQQDFKDIFSLPPLHLFRTR